MIRKLGTSCMHVNMFPLGLERRKEVRNPQ